MFSLIETNPRVEIQEAEYQRLLGYPKNHPLEGRALELANDAQSWFVKNGRPWICAREISSLEFKDKNTSISGVEFSSKKLREILFEADAHNALLVAISAGKECEEHARKLWEEGKPDEYFFLESYGSAVVEQLIVVASAHICAWADENKMAALPHFSPGYSGWDFAEQVPLWSLFQKTFGGKFPGDLEVLDSGMLRPKKSQLAVIGLTHDLEKASRFQKLIPCENCSLPNCRYRRAPLQTPAAANGKYWAHIVRGRQFLNLLDPETNDVWKLQIPSSKFQRNFKLQAPKAPRSYESELEL